MSYLVAVACITCFFLALQWRLCVWLNPREALVSTVYSRFLFELSRRVLVSGLGECFKVLCSLISHLQSLKMQEARAFVLIMLSILFLTSPVGFSLSSTSIANKSKMDFCAFLHFIAYTCFSQCNNSSEHRG